MRIATLGDYPLIEAALFKLLDKSPALQMKYVHPPTALANVKKAIEQGRCYIEQGYFLMYDIGPPWYMAQECLIEELILKIEPTDAPVRVAIRAMVELARTLGCEVMVAGDTQVGYMTPHYIAEGFNTLGTQLMKEIPNGIRSEDHRRSSTD